MSRTRDANGRSRLANRLLEILPNNLASILLLHRANVCHVEDYRWPEDEKNRAGQNSKYLLVPQSQLQVGADYANEYTKSRKQKHGYASSIWSKVAFPHEVQIQKREDQYRNG